MRVLYIDIDSLRPDHLGCYGYHRNTSPHIDQLAAEGQRFNNIYVSDAPCLPSRTALWSGRFGYHTGVVGHGSTAADPIPDGEGRSFRDSFAHTGWMTALRRAGFHTATVSPFGERHAAWHWYAGYNEIYNTGQGGMERADEVAPVALDWLERNGARDNWFLHVNFWDPHTPYRTPDEAGNPFSEDDLPAWLSEDVRARAWQQTGMRCGQELNGWGGESDHEKYARVPEKLDSMQAVRQMIDGYDVGVRYADAFVGQLVAKLDQLGVKDETVIMISADHGENLGEIGVWGDHQTADHITCRVPLIVRWPGTLPAGSTDDALHYHFDWAATLVELLGGEIAPNWDGVPFTDAIRAGESAGRDFLLISQNAHVCQRAARFTHEGTPYLCIFTYHDGFKLYDDVMLFDLAADPHEQHNLADERPDLVAIASAHYVAWQREMALSSPHNIDPMLTVLRERGPFHARPDFNAYLAHLRRTDRAAQADALAAKYPQLVN